MKVWIFIAFGVLSIMSQAIAEMDGRFLYVSKSKSRTDYILSDGPGREADIKTSNIDDIVKAIERLGHTGSMNYIAIRVHGRIKIASLLPVIKAIEDNPTWELAVLQRGDGIRAGIVLHNLEKNDPQKKRAEKEGVGASNDHGDVSIDYAKHVPLQVIAMLAKSDSDWVQMADAPKGWIRQEHIPELIKLLDSKQPCAGVHSNRAARVPGIGNYGPRNRGRSTIGHEAAHMIEGFRHGLYPKCSGFSVDFKIDIEKVRAWWQTKSD